MNILALDTSGGAASAAVWGGGLISEVYLHRENKHSETAMCAVDDALRTAGMGKGDIGLLAVCTGPGSFTGLRIGVSIIKGIAQALSLPCVAINTLEALKQNISNFDGILCPVMDARRGEVYATASLHGSVLYEYGAYTLTEYLHGVGEAGGNACFVGDGAIAYRETIERTLGDRAFFAPPQLMLQRAGAAAMLASKAAEAEYLDAYTILPNYFRLSQAERLKRSK